MSWSGGYATISMGGTPINLTNSTKASQMATPSIGTRMISFNSDLIAEIDRKAKFNGRLKYPNGDEFNLKDMQIRNLNTPFDYSFDVFNGTGREGDNESNNLSYLLDVKLEKYSVYIPCLIYVILEYHHKWLLLGF